MNLYCVFDKVAEEAGPIFEAKNDAIAQRNFMKLLERTGGMQSDFVLYSVGKFDHIKMEIDSFVAVDVTPDLTKGE